MGLLATLEFGPEGAAAAAARGSAVAIVDTLSFSSTVVTGVQAGARILPVLPGPEAADLATREGARLAVSRARASTTGELSLSPPLWQFLPPGTRAVLPSPNGAAACLAAMKAPFVVVACLLNALAVARALMESGRAVSVIACGEWKGDGPDRHRRRALEDLLGAGAVLSRLELPRSQVAEAAVRTFRLHERHLLRSLMDSESGRELSGHGFPEDVTFAARLDRYGTAPRVLPTGWIERPGD